MDLGLAGKVVFLTGASSGIGLAAAELLAAEGCFVIAGYKANAASAGALLDAIQAKGGSGMTAQLDLGDVSSIRRCVTEIVARVKRVDAVIFNAAHLKITPMEDISEAEWDETFAVNLKGNFFLLQAIAPHIAIGGAAVFVSSIAGQMGSPGHAHYAAAKAGMINLAKSAAKRYASAIRVNCVAPGVTLTPLGRDATKGVDPSYAQKLLLSRRFAEPAEVARVIVFLASPAASFIYGATVDANGGRELR